MKSVFETINLINKIQSASALDQYLTTNPQDENFINCLMYNVFEKRRGQFIEFLPVLMKRGGNINQPFQQTKKITIFMTACIDGEVEIVRKMLEYKVDLNLRDSEKNNVLILVLYALDNKNVDKMIAIVDMLLKREPRLAESETKDKSALIIAGQFGNLTLIRLFLEYLSDVNLINPQQATILHMLAKQFKNKEEQIELIKLLIEKKINVNARNSQGRSAADMVDPEYKSQFDQILKQALISKEDKKRSMHNVSRQMLKLNNNMIKNSIKTFKLNDKEDEEARVDQASEYLIQYLEERIRTLQIQKAQKEQQVKRVEEEQRALEIERNKDWIIHNQQLKYYLEEEILLFAEIIEEKNHKDKEHYDKLIAALCENLQQQLDIQVKVYGSFATRLCLSESDIDVVVVPNRPIDGLGATIDLLEKIDVKLRNLSFISSSKVIKSATIPVIKIVCGEQYNWKKMDISFQDNRHNGLDCVKIIKQYMEKYKQLKPLTFVLKTIIYSSNLYDTYQGGLSSYGLILMIVAVLQAQQVMKKDDEKIFISQILIKFLWWYGFEFDYISKAILVESPLVNINQHNYRGFWVSLPTADVTPKLVLVDPLDPTNNVGRSTHQIKQVERVFSNAYSVIGTNYSCMNKDCQYRKRVEKAQLPKEMIETATKARPCCILKRAFESSKYV